MNILLVDDNDLDALMIERALRRMASSTVILRARDGTEALEIIGTDSLPQPFFVLLDINMPRMNGHEFLARLRTEGDWSDSIVFMLTTSDSVHDIEMAYGGRANGYFVKPSDREGVARFLATLQEFWSICEPPGGRTHVSK